MVFCTNCHCEIDENKMFLHERFCKQNVRYCEKCEEAIPIEEFDEHVLSHADKEDEKNPQKKLSKEEKMSRSLERVMSSKVGCEYCGLPLSMNEIEEHEEMCGARTTQCNICHQNMTYKILKSHIKVIHNLDKSEYDNSQLSNKNSNKINENFSGNLSDSALNRMNSEEQMAYALKMSQKEDNVSNLKNENSKNIEQPDFSKMTEAEQIAYAIEQSKKDGYGK